MDLARDFLLTDLYQLNMMQAYIEQGETKTAVFEFFVRKLPDRRGFLIAAGLEQALDFLENLRVSRRPRKSCRCARLVRCQHHGTVETP